MGGDDVGFSRGGRGREEVGEVGKEGFGMCERVEEDI